MKIYFARPITLYGTEGDDMDKLVIRDYFSTYGGGVVEIIDPVDYQEEYKKEGMAVFLRLVGESDMLVFRSFSDGKIGAGVWKEIQHAQYHHIPVVELPWFTPERILDVPGTRERIKYNII